MAWPGGRFVFGELTQSRPVTQTLGPWGPRNPRKRANYSFGGGSRSCTAFMDIGGNRPCSEGMFRISHRPPRSFHQNLGEMYADFAGILNSF